MMNANASNAERRGKRRVQGHWFGIAAIRMRIRFFEFSPVLDEIWSAHGLFSFGTNIDRSGEGVDRDVGQPGRMAASADDATALIRVQRWTYVALRHGKSLPLVAKSFRNGKLA